MGSIAGEDTDWNIVATSWTVSAGRLADSVAVESPLSPIDDGAAGSTPKTPLLLRPPSPDRSPCEITISFAQRHEVRQVYVRSTARVYEIYYAPKQQTANEYLCTVRCGIVERDGVCDGDVPQAANLASPGDSMNDLAGGRSKNEINSNAGEDDWVEVKAPSTSFETNRDVTASLKSSVKMDFYEATAEITDADPCTSLTIRLLSVQSGDCVYIDEIYVFAEPVESNFEDEDRQSGTASGTSLMAMLVPSILQLSKMRTAGQVQDKDAFDVRNDQKCPPAVSETTEPNLGSKVTVTADVANRGGHVTGILDTQHMERVISEPAQETVRETDTNRKQDVSYSHFGSVLEQLVSRVSRIESLCLRFEENMIKPISSIEARLQRVEEQLEVINHRAVSSGLQTCKRFSAPECSFSESNITSLYESNRGESHSDGGSSDILCVPPDETHDTVSTSQLLPSFTMSAPDFPHGEDDEESHVLQQVADSPEEKPRPASSIDDALASALAGFASSITIFPPNYTQSLAVKAPEFSNEDEENFDERTSPEIPYDGAHNSVCMTDGMECVMEIISSELPSGDGESNTDRTITSNDGCSEKINEESDYRSPCDKEKCYVHVTGGEHKREEINEPEEASSQVRCVLAGEDTDVKDEMPWVQIDGGPHLLKEVESFDCTRAFEVANGKSEGSILHDILTFSQAACALDFKAPILDVKFIAQEKSDSQHLLKALWDEMPESNVSLPCDDKSCDSSGEQDDLIVVDNAELLSHATGCCFTVDFDYCDLLETPVNKDAEKLQDNSASSHDVLVGDSLI
ncbi:hypothetical protein EUGRSUZ_J01280 [Eucalyptus grandis]|uniref:Uncharacterized protein n=2 Tax=Eucalyptus grandis TaxID=71139 RepID=A0A059ACL5_EUCGR|nr:hypothetical protein EUGRSUZ_J01280 [Eucalyptus grandis]